MKRWLAAWAAFGLMAVVAAAQESPPSLELDSEGRLVLAELPALLDEPEVERHLESGLTTSLVVEARLQRPQIRGAARVDIRLELWDEVFLVTVIDGAGRISRLEPASAEELRSWWSEARIALSEPLGRPLEGSAQARVSISVVPFSQSELVDAQRWLAESMAPGEPGARGGQTGATAVGALIATSIQRRAVHRLAWNVQVSRREEP